MLLTVKEECRQNIATIQVKGSPSYYKEFKFFCSVYKNREELLSQAILKYLPKGQKTNKEPFRILDVGSSDGILLENLISELSQRVKAKIAVVALEPDREAFSYLNKRFKDVNDTESKGFSIDCLKMKLEDYLLKTNDQQKYDLILCSHVFYHFKPAIWKLMIFKLSEKLKDNGILITILDSYDSPIYKLKPEVIRYFVSCEDKIFGDEISGENFSAFLNKFKIHFYDSYINSYLLLAADKIIQDFFCILSFLYRHKIIQNSSSHKLIFNWMKANSYPVDSNYYEIKWRENIFVITK